MKKFVGAACACLLMIGCGGYQQDEVIAEITKNLGSLSGTLVAITKDVNDAVKALQGDDVFSTDPVAVEGNERVKAANKNITEAIKKAEGLRKLGKELQRLSVYGENLKEQTSTSQREGLLEQHRERIVGDLTRLDKEYQDLEIALAQAATRSDDSGKARLAELRKEVIAGRDAFDLLNKVR